MDKMERREYYRVWYLKNRVRRAEYNHKRYLKNGTEYYHKDREAICAARKEKVECEFCGRTVTRGALSAHHYTLVCSGAQPGIPFTLNFD